MEAPIKLYVDTNDHLTRNGFYASTERYLVDSIEYTRTDAFIEKSCEYIKEHLFDYWSQSVTNESKFIEDFINYMKGE